MANPAGPAVASPLERWAGAVEAQKETLRGFVEPLTQRQFEWRPEPDKWSVEEHAAHLNLTTRDYVRAIDGALERARVDGIVGSPPYRDGWVGRWFVRSLEPPVRLRVKTFDRLEPQGGRAKDAVVHEFATVHDAVIRSLETARGLDLGRVKIRSPFVRWLKLSVGQAYRAVLAHNRRHLWHMSRVMESPDAPTN